MKKIVFILFVSATALFISSCGSKTQDDHSGVHTHEDGAVHQDGDHKQESQAKPEQESFEVGADSLETHSHEEGDHDHKHQH